MQSNPPNGSVEIFQSTYWFNFFASPILLHETAPGASVEIETSDNGANRDGSSRPSPKAKTSQWGAERVNEVE